MKRLLLAGLLAMTSAFTAQAEVSVTVGQPGFYGRIDIGGYPQPQVVYPQPIIITPAPTHHNPVYLRVPPGHVKDWGKHCHHYNACNEPVYFVDDNWYERDYVPRYQEQHGRHFNNNRDNKNRENKPRHYKQNGHNKGNKGNKHGNQGNRGNRGNRGNNGNQGNHGRGH